MTEELKGCDLKSDDLPIVLGLTRRLDARQGLHRALRRRPQVAVRGRICVVKDESLGLPDRTCSGGS